MQSADCGQTPTCRIRFWCSGCGGPPSGDVLQEEAIFASRSELPPLERLPSGLLDILCRDGCCWMVLWPIVKRKRALPPLRDAPGVLLCPDCVCMCGDVNAPQMRFPETPQDQ
ncbi:hypothetical protein NQZ68_031407 [Dissostichus eleginoides]|nr:hypothetical protein NQZ68_031407 [Dissostichus eleginoides]